MDVTNEAVQEKIRIMYPEIAKHNISMNVDFDSGKDAFVVKFHRGEHELNTYLDKKDAEECLNDIKCIHLGNQIAQFVKNFEMV
jgi:hypothetical protein